MKRRNKRENKAIKPFCRQPAPPHEKRELVDATDLLPLLNSGKSGTRGNKHNHVVINRFNDRFQKDEWVYNVPSGWRTTSIQLATNIPRQFNFHVIYPTIHLVFQALGSYYLHILCSYLHPQWGLWTDNASGESRNNHFCEKAIVLGSVVDTSRRLKNSTIRPWRHEKAPWRSSGRVRSRTMERTRSERGSKFFVTTKFNYSSHWKKETQNHLAYAKRLQKA